MSYKTHRLSLKCDPHYLPFSGCCLESGAEFSDRVSRDEVRLTRQSNGMTSKRSLGVR